MTISFSMSNEPDRIVVCTFFLYLYHDLYFFFEFLNRYILTNFGQVVKYLVYSVRHITIYVFVSRNIRLFFTQKKIYQRKIS